MKTLPVLFGVGAALLLGLSAMAPRVVDGGVPAVAWQGAHSKITTRRIERIRDSDAWEKAWHEHTGTGVKFQDRAYDLPPRIDFGRFEVVAVFTGSTVNQDGEEVVSIEKVDGSLRIRFDSITYQTSAPLGQVDHGVASEPFGIWVIDRTTLPIVVEENVQGLIGKPPEWKEQKRFEAPAP